LDIQIPLSIESLPITYYFVVPSLLLVAVACLREDFVNAVLYIQQTIIITTTRTTTTILSSARTIATLTDITNNSTNNIQRTWPTVDENDLLSPILPREEELLRTHRSATTTATKSSRCSS
jgi:hypothetical protein